LSIESTLARPEVKETERLANELIVSCALKDAENVMPSLDREACSRLEILYRLPVSVLRCALDPNRRTKMIEEMIRGLRLVTTLVRFMGAALD